MSRAIPFVATLVIAGVTLFSPAESNAGDDVCDWQNNPYNRPEGHLITRQSHPEISLTEGCNRRPFTDTTSLLSHNLDGGVRVVSDQEYNQLPSAGQIRAREGTVFRNSSTGWYYIIDRSGTSTFKKRLITSNRWQQWFASCNYPYTSVTWSYLDTYPTGSTISETTPQRPDGQLIATPDGKVYQLEDGKKRWIRSPAKNSYNFAQPSCNVSYSEANSFSNGPDMWAREGTLFRGSGDPVYIVRRTVTNSYLKRHIAGPNAFSYYGYSWGNVKQWSDSEVNQYASGAHAHPVKGTLVTQWGEWYKSLVTNDLTMHRYHAPGTRSWESQITAARNAWNAAPIAPDFVEMSQNSSNDVHVEVRDFGGMVGWGGQAVVIETQGGKIRKMRVDLSDWQGYVQSQYLVSHELGHVVLLAHDGIAGGVGDGFCGGTRVPQTVMDYDCTSLTGPANWDSCGVNHIHHAGSYGGC